MKLFVIIGIGLLLGAAYWGYATHQFIGQAQTAPGTVIALKESCDTKSCTYRPRVRYLLPDNQRIEFEGTGTSPPAFDIGEEVQVFYDLAKPHQAKINAFFSLWGGPLILAFIGAIFTAVGCVVKAGTKTATPHQTTINNVPIQATVTRITQEFSLTGGDTPWYIFAEWTNPETYLRHRFRSPPLQGDPRGLITEGSPITVLFDSRNASRFQMDVSRFL